MAGSPASHLRITRDRDSSPATSPFTLLLASAFATFLHCGRAARRGNLAADGRLIYARFAGQSPAGFRRLRLQSRPRADSRAPVRVTLSPGDGDDRAAFSRDCAGRGDAGGRERHPWRGLLTAGEYQLSSTLDQRERRGPSRCVHRTQARGCATDPGNTRWSTSPAPVRAQP